MDKIIILDDDQVSLLLAKTLLEAEGYSVTTYDNALNLAMNYTKGCADLILSDFMMPEMNGGELLRIVRQTDTDTPFLILTSLTDVNVTVELFKDGVTDYLLKPINPKEMLHRVDKALEERRLHDELARINQEKMLIDLENKKIVNWRNLYAFKDISQTEQMINLLTKTINAAGGYIWLDLLKDLPARPDGSKELSTDMVQLIVNSAEAQKTVFDYLGFISHLPSMKLNNKTVPGRECAITMAEFARTELDSLCSRNKHPLLVYLADLDFRGTVDIDFTMIKKVCRELIVNAVKYSQPESRIQLEIAHGHPKNLIGGHAVIEKQTENCLALIVRNTPRQLQAKDASGQRITGIPYDYSELVFDLFFTIESFPVPHPDEEWSDGTGLYVARKLLKRMGGWLETSNIMDHTGAKPLALVQFAVLLPLDTATP